VAGLSACGLARDRQVAGSDSGAVAASGASTPLAGLVHSAPQLSLKPVELSLRPPNSNWRTGSISWMAADRGGLIYLVQRGDDVDPIVVVDHDGRVVRSWGKGMYIKAHAIRIDPQGNVWTVDAATSMVRKYAPKGRLLMQIDVGGRPQVCMDQQAVPESERPTGANNFCGATDVAFAPNGHVFIADGYANNRVLEYSTDGKKLTEWGTTGSGAGQFRLPHSIGIDDGGTIYVSDRENGRIQRFDLTGKYLGEWSHLGRIYSLEIRDGAIWIATQPLEQPNSAPGWLLKLDRATGRLLGYADIVDGHAVATLETGELLVTQGAGAWWFRPAR
jgi:DNA-binding beta-propeller fold protein YncE